MRKDVFDVISENGWNWGVRSTEDCDHEEVHQNPPHDTEDKHP